MPAAHLIYGYLGAGKTTFARQLERDIPAIRFSHDEWMVRLYGDDPPIEQFAVFYWRIHEQVEAIWLRCLELGLDVVLDFGFWTRRERDARVSSNNRIGPSAAICVADARPTGSICQILTTRSLSFWNHNKYRLCQGNGPKAGGGIRRREVAS